jgi:hypothetical protein
MMAKINTTNTEEMRSLGRSLLDKGMVEYSIPSGEIAWCNSYVLDKIGHESQKTWDVSIFDMIPNEFHKKLKEHISNISSNGSITSIWPVKTQSGKLSWWYVFQTKTYNSTRWIQVDYIQTTETDDIACSFMRMQMDIMYKCSDLNTKVDELDKWVSEKIDELTKKDNELFQSISEITELTSSLIDTKNSIDQFKGELRKQFKELDKKSDEHTTEILKLIGSSVVHSKRLNAFEKHVKMTTDLAIKSITLQTEKAGKGLSKKIAVPVSIVSIIAAIIQYLIQNWSKNQWPF